MDKIHKLKAVWDGNIHAHQSPVKNVICTLILGNRLKIDKNRNVELLQILELVFISQLILLTVLNLKYLPWIRTEECSNVKIDYLVIIHKFCEQWCCFSIVSKVLSQLIYIYIKLDQLRVYIISVIYTTFLMIVIIKHNKKSAKQKFAIIVKSHQNPI